MAHTYGSFPSAHDESDEAAADPTKGLRRTRSRNERFNAYSEPFYDNDDLHLQHDRVDGVFWFMNPTHATFTYLPDADMVGHDHSSEEGILYQRPGADYTPSSSEVEHKWSSRNNRKGRHALRLRRRSENDGSPLSTTSISAVLRGVWRMLTRFAFWDISYLIATSFTLAVTILLVNAVLSVLPYADPSFTPPDGITYIEGALTLAGCVFFFFSGFLTFVEAVNSRNEGCFGWKREQVPSHDTPYGRTEVASTTRIVPDWNCIHRQNNYSNLFNQSAKASASSAQEDANENAHHQTNCKSCPSTSRWKFFPSKRELRDHFIHDLGFVTCTVLLCSSAIYCSAALASFITILNSGQINPWVRIPQIIAGLGFATSSVLFMLETQREWLVPEIKAVGWQISFWNLLGSIGFTLCAVFALADAHTGQERSKHQMAYSYLWGSSGFLLGSLLQWYESLDKHPVEYQEKEG